MKELRNNYFAHENARYKDIEIESEDISISSDFTDLLYDISQGSIETIIQFSKALKSGIIKYCYSKYYCSLAAPEEHILDYWRRKNNHS